MSDQEEILFSSSEITYYDLIVEKKNLNSVEKISEQISNVIEGGESDSTSHLVLGSLNHFKDTALSSSYLSIESTDIDTFDYTIENKGKLVETPTSRDEARRVVEGRLEEDLQELGHKSKNKEEELKLQLVMSKKALNDLEQEMRTQELCQAV